MTESWVCESCLTIFDSEKEGSPLVLDNLKLVCCDCFTKHSQKWKLREEMQPLNHNEAIAKACNPITYPCHQKSAVMWTFCGASLESLRKDLVWKFIVHAEKCDSCQRFIVNELHFDDLKQFENCMLWVWAGKPQNWKPRP